MVGQISTAIPILQGNTKPTMQPFLDWGCIKQQTVGIKHFCKICPNSRSPRSEFDLFGPRKNSPVGRLVSGPLLGHASSEHRVALTIPLLQISGNGDAITNTRYTRCPMQLYLRRGRYLRQPRPMSCRVPMWNGLAKAWNYPAEKASRLFVLPLYWICRENIYTCESIRPFCDWPKRTSGKTGW